MVLKSEARFQGLVMRDLQLAGAIVFNVHGSAMQSSGWPDLLVFHGKLPGGCCGLELKMQGGAERTNQVVKLRKLSDRKFRCFFLRYWRDGDLTFEVQRHSDAKPRQVLQVSGWEASVQRHNQNPGQDENAARRERGHLLLDAVNEAWEHEFSPNGENQAE